MSGFQGIQTNYDPTGPRRTRYVLCAGGLVAKGDKVKLFNGKKFIFFDNYLDVTVEDIFSDRVLVTSEKTQDLITFARGDFIARIADSVAALNRVNSEINRMNNNER